MSTKSMSAQDALWLTMDRPNNLMVVDSIVVLEGMPQFEDVLQRFEDAVRRFPVLARRPLRRRNSWVWADREGFDATQQVHEVTLPSGSGVTDLQAFMAQQRSVPLDKERPLWVAFLVGPVTLEDGAIGSAVVARFHHAIADGVRLSQVLLGMCDPEEGTTIPLVSRKGVLMPSPVDVVRAATGSAARVSVAATQAAVGRASSWAGALTPTTSVNDNASKALALPKAGLALLGDGVDLIRHPDRILDAFQALGGGDHRTMNDMSSVTKLLLTDSDATVWTGEPGRVKDVAWSPPMSLPAVKAAARASGATVNDILVSAVAGGLQRYLADRGSQITEVVWMVPVNLKPFEEELPEDLGNHFALVMLPMPLGHETRAERLADIHRYMGRIKNSDEAVLTYELQRLISFAPQQVAEVVTNFFANKAIGVLTNVPGPTGGMSFAGAPVRQVLGFAPCSGDQPLTATIFTTNGQVTIGFAADAALVPGLHDLVAHVVDEIDALCGE